MRRLFVNTLLAAVLASQRRLLAALYLWRMLDTQ